MVYAGVCESYTRVYQGSPKLVNLIFFVSIQPLSINDLNIVKRESICTFGFTNSLFGVFPYFVLPKLLSLLNEPRHEKTCFLHMQKTKLQISCPLS